MIQSVASKLSEEGLDSEQYSHINVIPYHILFDDGPDEYHRVTTYFYPTDSILKSQLDAFIKREGFHFIVDHGTNPPSSSCCLFVTNRFSSQDSFIFG
jgi:hypothetical protein